MQTVHPRLIKMHMAKRLQSLEKGEGLDFATAEALAFGSLLLEGYHVRLCGQDSGRVRSPSSRSRKCR
jgi:probable 2-oxoglutarate dehydrogenase E1 component DHKTD1